ncbi:MAG: thiamine phosphate synthase [Bacteroidaceae bacterium]|nr:thiamine phosphate synthase [Bacteroidaceae bacterium]
MVPVQFITHHNERYSYEEGALLALEGGCKWVQLRIKNATDDEVEPLAIRLLEACRKHQATFIIDDRVELTKKVHADGVHLGKDDMSPVEARSLLGEEYLIGGTANTLEDVIALRRAGIDYICCGPFRHTDAKSQLAPSLNLEGYRNILSAMNEQGISLPICAIGGITRDDVPDLMRTGVRGIAVSGAVLRATNPVLEMQAFIHSY